MEKQFSKTFYLAAGECDAQGRMPVTLLVSRLIEIASLHANSWGVGYRDLITDQRGWVLSRLTIEMTEWLTVDRDYTIVTWVETYNRHYSQRCFEVIDTLSGTTLGYARTIWMVLDIEHRVGVDITALESLRDKACDRPCPIAPQSRLRPITAATRTTHYMVRYADCDFYRHMNTVRYVELLINQFDLSFHDNHPLQRLEMAFPGETRYGTELSVVMDESEPTDVRVQLDDSEGATHVRARLVFK